MSFACLLALLTGCVYGDAHDEVVRVFVVADDDEDPVVAVGGTLQVRFGILERLGDGTLSQTTIIPTGVSAPDPDVLELVDAGAIGGSDLDGAAIVRGHRAGRARLIVEARGRTFEVPVRVGRVARGELGDRLERVGTPARSLAYLAGTTARLELTLHARGGEVARGAGAVRPSDVRVSGPAELVDVSDTQVAVRLVAPGDVAIEVLGARRRLAVVAPAEVFTVQLAVRDTTFGGGCLAQPFDLRSVRQAAPADRFERSSYLMVRAQTADGRVLASAEGALVVESETPGHCTVRRTTRPNDIVDVLRFFHPESDGYQADAFDVLGGAPGECIVTATLAGASARRRIVVN